MLFWNLLFCSKHKDNGQSPLFLNLLFCSEYKDNGQSPETHYCKLLFCDPASCIIHNFMHFYVVWVKFHVRTKVPRFYSILYGPYKNVKLDFYCNFNCMSLFISATSSATLYFQLQSSPTGRLFSPWMHQLQWSVLLCVDNIYLVPQQALVVPCRLLTLCRGSIQCLNKALIVVWTLERRVFALASGNCDTLQGVSAILRSDCCKSHPW